MNFSRALSFGLGIRAQSYQNSTSQWNGKSKERKKYEGGARDERASKKEKGRTERDCGMRNAEWGVRKKIRKEEGKDALTR